MRAEREVVTRDVFKVLQWKHDLDPSEPWWKRALFRYVFLTFLDLAFRLGIPAVKDVVVESDDNGRVRRTFRWCEDQGIFDDPEKAEAACLGERWGYTKLPYGRLIPPESSQYCGTIYPRKKNPNKWAKPVLSLVLKDRKKEEHDDEIVNKYIARLHQALDR